MREAIRKTRRAALDRVGRRVREPGAPEITEAELESELKLCAPSFARPVRVVLDTNVIASALRRVTSG